MCELDGGMGRYWELMLLDADRTRISNELGEDTCELFELIELVKRDISCPASPRSLTP